MGRLVSLIVLFGRQRMALNETHYYFLSDYDSMHQLSVGGICPGETVISCLDDPDTEPMSYTNDGTESITAFFIVDAYNDAVGPFTLQWDLTLKGIFIFLLNFQFFVLFLYVFSLFR